MSGSTLVAIALLVLVPAAWSALLRWARCPGWPVVGGAVAGIILGPAIFGRVMPDRYEALLVGGAEQRQAIGQLERLQEADRLAAEHAGLDSAQMSALADRHAPALDEAQRRYRQARWAYQRPLRLFVCAVVAAMLLGAAACGVPRAREEQAVVGALSVGAWSAALPGGLAFFFLRWLWDAGASEAALAAAAVAIGPWVLTTADRHAADQAELGGARMVQTAGRVATAITLLLALGAMWQAERPHGLLWGTPLLAAALSWLIPAPRASSVSGPAAGQPGALRAVRGGLAYVLVPAVAASAAVRVDPLEDFAIWPIVVILLLSGDGRWLGAVTGATILGGRRGLRTMRLVLGSMAAGPTQLAVTAVAVHTWMIAPRFALALLLGAVLIEVTVPARRGMARRLIKTEQEIEEISRTDED
jgi:hypothetical protein